MHWLALCSDRETFSRCSHGLANLIQDVQSLISPMPQPIPRRRLPDWLRIRLPTNGAFTHTRILLDALRLHTVCESAHCPNQSECWSRGTATFMIGGDRCTRACRFCAVTTARPLPLDPDEPMRVAKAAVQMRLRYAVVTAVARDDLEDGGAGHFARTIEALHAAKPDIVVEVLTPDFNDSNSAIDAIVAACPDVFNHNLETVRRLTPSVRSRAMYDRSLSVLSKARRRLPARSRTKSGLMLGLGEKTHEVIEALRDLRGVGCNLLTLGQYLQSTSDSLPVAEFITPGRFDNLRQHALSLGFTHVASAPLVRSSYHADELADGSATA